MQWRHTSFTIAHPTHLPFQESRTHPAYTGVVPRGPRDAPQGEPTKSLDSTPRLRKNVDRRNTAKEGDVEYIKEWLQEEFPTSVTDVAEVDVQTEIDSLSQGREEPLAQYYQRAVCILRRTHG